MPAIVVHEVADWLAERGGRLVAGQTPPGLERGVANVARLRRVSPRELETLATNDVALVAGDILTPDAPFTLETLIRALAEAQACLVVAGLPPREAASDARPYAVADELALPLLALPAGTDLNEIASGIDDLIRRRELATGRFVRDALTAMSHARQAGDSLTTLGQALAEVTGLYFLLEDERRQRVLFAAPTRPPRDLAQVDAALASYAARQAVRAATPAAHSEDYVIQRHLPGKLARAIVPLRSGTVNIAYLSLIGPEDLVRSAHVDLLWRAASSFAFEIGRLRQEASDRRLTIADDLDALLRGALPEGELLRRSLSRGVDLNDPQRVLVAVPLREGDEWAPALPEEFWALTRDGATRLLLSAAAARDGALDRAVAALREEAPAGGLAFGLGRAERGVVGVRQSLREAEIAARARRALPGDGSVLEYETLGVLRLLYPLQATGELVAFARETLAPLLVAEPHAGDALLLTLEAWFAANGNLTEAARRLGLHRNTLIYRLRHVEEALGAHLAESDLRLALHLALKIWRVGQLS